MILNRLKIMIKIALIDEQFHEIINQIHFL